MYGKQLAIEKKTDLYVFQRSAAWYLAQYYNTHFVFWFNFLAFLIDLNIGRLSEHLFHQLIVNLFTWLQLAAVHIDIYIGHYSFGIASVYKK